MSPRPATHPARQKAKAALAAFVLFATLPGCTRYGVGIAELPAASGWERLPIGDWLANEGVSARTLVYCPETSCLRPAVALQLEAEGAAATKLTASLADSAALTRRTRRSPPRTIGNRPAPVKQPVIHAATHIERRLMDGAALTLVSLTPDRPEGHAAYVAILNWQAEGKERFALSATTDEASALAYARAAMRDWR